MSVWITDPFITDSNWVRMNFNLHTRRLGSIVFPRRRLEKDNNENIFKITK